VTGVVGDTETSLFMRLMEPHVNLSTGSTSCMTPGSLS
jgi:hypothetical protein